MTYEPRYFPDGRKIYDPSRTERQIYEEWEAFEHKLTIENPEWEGYQISLAARELWRQEEERKERWSEWQQRAWIPRMRANSEKRQSENLTPEEWDYLSEILNGANHPLGASIWAKSINRT